MEISCSIVLYLSWHCRLYLTRDLISTYTLNTRPKDHLLHD